MHQYADANAIAGSAGLFPSRSQFDQSHNSGPIFDVPIPFCVDAVAESLACHCGYYCGISDADKALEMHVRNGGVKTAKKAAVGYWFVAPRTPHGSGGHQRR